MKQFASVLLVIILIAALGWGGYYLMQKNLNPAADNLKEDFIGGIPGIFRTPGGNLEVAGFKAVETFRSTSTALIPMTDIEIPLTTTKSLIQVPVTYRYHVRVFEEWNIEARGFTCVVYAPELRPTLPPAIQTDSMETIIEEDLMAWDGEAQLNKLIKTITPTLEKYAADPKNIDRVREDARRTVAEFVRIWLIERGQWGDKVEVIKVIFRGERETDPDQIIPSEIYRGE